MNDLPNELVEHIILAVHPLDYVNFLLAYDRALEMYRYTTLARRYKAQYIREVKEQLQWYRERVKDRHRIGPCISRFSSGPIISLCSYRDGNLHGEYFEFNQNGSLYKYAEYQNGYRNGWSITFHYNGTVESMIFYINEVQQGNTEYYTSTGTFISSQTPRYDLLRLLRKPPEEPSEENSNPHIDLFTQLKEKALNLSKRAQFYSA
jgi:hypothetical protein